MARAVKRCLPAASVSMLIRDYTAELVEADRNVDEAVRCTDSAGRPLPFGSMVSELRKRRFDVAIHTHPRPAAALMTWLAGIPVRVGTGYRWYSFLFNRRVYEHRSNSARHELEYNLRLLDAVGCPDGGPDFAPAIDLPEAALVKARRTVDALEFRPGEKLVIVHPGSGGSGRDWPTAKFAALAGILAGTPGVRVIVTGGPAEKEIVGTVAAGAGGRAGTIVGGLSVIEFAAVAHLGSLLIANSTGPIHLASAVGTPVLGFYSQLTALNATRWGPYTTRKTIFTPEGKPADCGDCRGKGDFCACMDSIGVENVASAALVMLGGPPS
jgi:ADP-heptose:LPS heptosyltransferase